jgi:hypothetical protein
MLDSRDNLASIYWSQGRWKEAVKLQAQAVEARGRVLGKEHPDTLQSVANLGVAEAFAEFFSPSDGMPHTALGEE